MIITAAPEDIIAIRSLDNFTFAQATLSIKAEGPTAEEVLGGKKEKSEQTRELEEKMKTALSQRYNAELRLLNLSNLATDPLLKEMGEETTTPSKIFPALMAVCDEYFKSRKARSDTVESVSLADNGITTVADVQLLSKTFPDLKNLDLSRNALSDMASFSGWKFRFSSLVNLVLVGNPIEQQLSILSNDLLQQFPSLQIINDVPVRTADEAAAAKAAALSPAAKSKPKNTSTSKTPTPFPLGQPDFRDTSQVGENFIKHFIPLYDHDRQALLNTYYDGVSRVSISINTQAPYDKALGPIPGWESYMKHSRNMVKITRLPAQIARQHCGQERIMELWKDLPATRHPDLMLEPLKYTIECNPLPGLVDPTGASPTGVDGLLIMVHGEFEEHNTKVADRAMRSFDRTFIIGPGATSQQPIRVINDMMVLRAWGPVAQPEQPQTPPQEFAVPVQSNIPPDMSQEQYHEAMAAEVSARTGMKIEYSRLCLEQVGWDFEAGLRSFAENRSNLPAEAFVSQL